LLLLILQVSHQLSLLTLLHLPEHQVLDHEVLEQGDLPRGVGVLEKQQRHQRLLHLMVKSLEWCVESQVLINIMTSIVRVVIIIIN